MSTPLRILDEDRKDLKEASEFLRQSMVTTRRMINVGAETPSGPRVYLEHLHVGGKIITSRQAIERYLAAINGIDVERSGGAENGPPPAKRRQLELARVDRELDAEGY
jgi:hypothetical protein